MAILDQDNRQLTVTTPLGRSAFVAAGMTGSEGVSELYEYRVELLALSSTVIDFDRLLGQKAAVTVDMQDGKKRYFGGIVSRVNQGGTDLGLDDVPVTSYTIHIVPSIWLLTRRQQTRIFQQQTVPEILEAVLQGFDVSLRLQGSFEPRNYTTQYRETDFDFISRLMEEEGIYYFFEHTAQGSTLILADTPGGHPELSFWKQIRYEPIEGGNRPEGRVQSWEKAQELRSGKVTLWDHHFQLPGKNLEATVATKPRTVQVGGVAHKLEVGGTESLEVYDYPGDYAHRFDGVDPGGSDRGSDLQKPYEENARVADLRMGEVQASAISIRATSDCPHLLPGYRFTLDGLPGASGEYVVTSVQHAAGGQSIRSGRTSELKYENSFTCIPMALPFRPARKTSRPRVFGCQTATVVGPAGEEIFTDRYGRVKVQFHWDREGQSDSGSSCWIRVSTSWAGRQWGAVHIPRIGQEVIVDFIEGDPDRPIIVGMVYNADQMPPYPLPENKTRSGVKSRSSLNGSAENFNEIRFEDKKDAEQIYIHAEKDLDAVIENNETRSIGFDLKDSGDQTVTIFNNQTIDVGADGCGSGDQKTLIWNDQHLTVGNGKGKAAAGDQNVSIWSDQNLTVGAGKGAKGSQIASVWKDRQTTIETGDDVLQIKQGNRKVSIDLGNDTLTISMGNQTTKIDLGKSTTEAMQGIELKVGQNSIKIDQMGITIKGMMVKIEGQIQTEVKGLMTQVTGTAMLKAGGGIVMLG